jgi:hypothetical protein
MTGKNKNCLSSGGKKRWNPNGPEGMQLISLFQSGTIVSNSTNQDILRIKEDEDNSMFFDGFTKKNFLKNVRKAQKKFFGPSMASTANKIGSFPDECSYLRRLLSETERKLYLGEEKVEKLEKVMLFIGRISQSAMTVDDATYEPFIKSGTLE